MGAGLCMTSGCIARETGAFVVACDLIDRKANDTAFVKCDARALPFRDKAFSTILCAYVLHHTAEHEGVLRELCRVGHRIILQENVYSNWIQKLLLTLHGWSFKKYYGLSSEYEFKSEREWAELSEKLSLSVLCTERMIPFPLFPVGHRQFTIET